LWIDLVFFVGAHNRNKAHTAATATNKMEAQMQQMGVSRKLVFRTTVHRVEGQYQKEIRHWFCEGQEDGKWGKWTRACGECYLATHWPQEESTCPRHPMAEKTELEKRRKLQMLCNY
jgi:hypothetical protein